MSTIQISVTEKDIRQGQRSSRTTCPIALAAKRVKGFDSDSVRVSSNCLYVKSKEKLVANLPPEAQSFIMTFDEVGNGNPFQFEIYLLNLQKQTMMKQ